MTLFARRSLFWKYAAYFAGLVSALLVVSGAVAGYFAYRESVSALEEVQRAKVHFAATEIANFVENVQDAMHAAVNKFKATRPVEPGDLRLELSGLLHHYPEVSELAWLAADGTERLALTRFGLNVADSGRNWSDDPRFHDARTASIHVGEVYFRKETEPYVSLAVLGSSGSVLSAEVNLKYVWDVVSQEGLRSRGVVYVVDRRGQLISHPDIGLVLARTDLSKLSHVRSIVNGMSRDITVFGDARDHRGLRVLSTAAPIVNLGWTVFAEQPIEEAFRPVYAAIARSVALVLLGIGAAVAVSLLLARRMVRPIREIETRARELGEGQLDRRIALRTGDELEALAVQFNRMASSLQDTHAMQETRIAERTRDLAAANEAKTRFLATAAHDLRQPIHALALFVGQLRAIDLPGDAPALLDKTERSIDALRDLLEACLDLSRLDIGAVTTDVKPMSLSDFLSRVVAEFAPSAEAKGLALTLAPTSLWVRSDSVLLHRIMLNVLSNALRYTVEGRILIGCRRRGENVELVVADTGVGIDPVHLPNVFQEFYRAAPGKEGMSSGLGLGLAIVRRLASLLDHRVSIRSEPGKGTVVSIAIPRAEPQKPAGMVPTMSSESLRGVRVLVVDDEAPARESMQGLLARWGCEVAAAENGEEALKRARELKPDVVLCDLSLAGGENGTDVVDRIRRACGASIACAFVTGESAPDRLAAVRASGHTVSFKPTTPAKLRALVEHLLQSA